MDQTGHASTPLDFRNIVLGKIERNDPERHLAQEIDVYYRYNWAAGVMEERSIADPVVLELGCGLGWFGRVLASRYGPGLQFTGVDIEAGAIAEARKRSHGDARLRFLAADVTRLADAGFEEGTFDYIIWFENLEHVRPDNFAALVGEVRALLKPGGELLVETPNRIAGGGLRAVGPLRRSSKRFSNGQHNPHHYFEPTLEEVRFLFPDARVEGFEPGDQLYILKALAMAGAALLDRLGISAVRCRIHDAGAIDRRQLIYLSLLRWFPSWNRLFLIRERRRC